MEGASLRKCGCGDELKGLHLIDDWLCIVNAIGTNGRLLDDYFSQYCACSELRAAPRMPLSR